MQAGHFRVFSSRFFLTSLQRVSRGISKFRGRKSGLKVVTLIKGEGKLAVRAAGIDNQIALRFDGREAPPFFP